MRPRWLPRTCGIAARLITLTLASALCGRTAGFTGFAARFATPFQYTSQQGLVGQHLCLLRQRGKGAQHRLRMTGGSENDDICRLPDGNPFSSDWLASAIGDGNAGGLTYSIPAADVVRGPHSVAARLLLHRDATASADSTLPTSVFVKRVVPAELPARAAPKWMRDCASYRAEVGFYTHLLEPLRQQGVLLPMTYKVVAEGLEDLTNMLAVYASSPQALSTTQIESVVMRCQFVCLVEDLNPARYRQEMLLGTMEMKRTLAAVAKMHGVTFSQAQMLKEAQECVFEQGAYWSPDKRDPSEVVNLPKVWDEWLSRFGEAIGRDLAQQEGVRKLGQRLSATAHQVSARVADAGKSDYSKRCLVHGDLKTANLLFANHWDAEALDSGQGGVMMIDFQWTGVASPAQDLAYLFVSSAHLDILENSEEMRQLLEHYLTLLAQASQGRSAKYTVEELQRDMDLVLLEYARTVFGYQLKGKGPEWVESGGSTLGRCAHNRHLAHLRWLVVKVENTLTRLESGAL